MHENRKIIDKVDLPLLTLKGIALDVLRLDKLHPVVSGNKWFKLQDHLRQALDQKAGRIITFGGAWSNHIVAAAFAAREAGIPITGIIRGDRPAVLSTTLQEAQSYGMSLQFITREAYAERNAPEIIQALAIRYPDAYIIPEGGAGKAGISGAAKILSLADPVKYTHILCAVGTGTTWQGLISAAAPHQLVIGIVVLKGITHWSTLLQSETLPADMLDRSPLISDYHFGGYARRRPELIAFMNDFYHNTGIPSDFVYTGKLFFAAMDMILKDQMPPGSRLLLIHSGGLQGNRSLSEGTLSF